MDQDAYSKDKLGRIDRRVDQGKWLIQGEEIVGPSTLPEFEYVCDIQDDISDKYDYSKDDSGKWMMFFHNNDIDSQWTKACKLYRAGELTGIRIIYASTCRYNKKSSDQTKNVIVFYCGPDHDEELMKQYGHNLLYHIKYHSSYGPMAYKTDVQSAIGTRASGARPNFIYMLPVPRVNSSHDQESTSSRLSSGRGRRVAKTKAQANKTTENKSVTEISNAIHQKYDYDASKSGYWLMYFQETWLNKAWRNACDLYKDEKLPGIQSLMVSPPSKTDSNNTASGGTNEMGMIKCFCGPSDDLDLVKSYGETLAKRVNYFDPSGRMAYLSEGEAVCTVNVPCPWRRREVREN